MHRAVMTSNSALVAIFLTVEFFSLLAINTAARRFVADYKEARRG